MKKIEYDYDKQKLFLNSLISDPAAFVRCQSILSEDHWNEQLKPALRYVLEYAEEYSQLPTVDQINAYSKVKLEKITGITDIYSEWLLGEIESFTRHRAMELVIMEAADSVAEGAYAEIETKLKEALTISISSDLGMTYWEAPEERLKDLLDKKNVISTGWATLDAALYGGFSKGALNVFAGGSGCVVKGTRIEVKEQNNISFMNIEDLEFINTNERKILVNSPDGFVEPDLWRNKGIKPIFEVELENGYKITASDDHLFQSSKGEWIFTKDLQVDTELMTDTGSSRIKRRTFKGEDVVYDLSINHTNHRYFTNGISSHNSGKSLFLQNLALNWAYAGLNVIYFSIELGENLIATRVDSMVTGYNMKDVFKNIDKVSMAVTLTGKKSGDLKIKKYPEAGTTCNHLRAYLQEYIIQTGHKPDAILVDYLDILYPNNPKINPSDMFIRDKYVSEELRALAHEFDVVMATGSQLNRGAVSVAEYNHSHIAGGVSKINTADNVFGIIHGEHLKERGMYQLQMLKTRSSNATGRIIDLKYNVESMRITDLPPENEDAAMLQSTPSSTLSSLIKGKLSAQNNHVTPKKEDLGTSVMADPPPLETTNESEDQPNQQEKVPEEPKSKTNKMLDLANRLNRNK